MSLWCTHHVLWHMESSHTLIGHFEGRTRCMTCNPAWSSGQNHYGAESGFGHYYSLYYFVCALVVSLKAGFQPIIPASLQQYGFCHFRSSSPHQDSQSVSHDILVSKFHFPTDSAPGHIMSNILTNEYWATVNAGVCHWVVAAKKRNKSRKKSRVSISSSLLFLFALARK